MAKIKRPKIVIQGGGEWWQATLYLPGFDLRVCRPGEMNTTWSRKSAALKAARDAYAKLHGDYTHLPNGEWPVEYV